ncbi:tetratricopeptide repeat protein [Furfurilactobacillus sp. WILCCON 0119]
MSDHKKQTKKVTEHHMTEPAQTAAANAAVTKLIKQIDEAPQNYHLSYELATVLLEMQDYEQAEELLLKTRSLFPDDEAAIALLTYGLGNVYYQAALYDKAAAAFGAVTDKTLQVEAYQMLAQTYMQQNDYQKAFAFALTVHDAKRQDKTVNAMLGDILLAMGNFNQAADFYDQSLASDPKNGPVNFSRALTAMVLDQDPDRFMAAATAADPQFVADGQQRIDDIVTLINDRKQQTH